MKKSELLRKAVNKYLSTTLSDLDVGNPPCYPCICDCLSIYTRDRPELIGSAFRIKSFINRLLGGRHTLYDWLYQRGYCELPLRFEDIDPETYAKIQATRKAWAEWIAQQYEAIGE